MRRKTKANASSESPEKGTATRRSTRRGRVSPPVEEVPVEYDKSEGDTSSENDEEYSPKKRRAVGRRKGRSKASSGSDREAKASKTRTRRRAAAKKIEEHVEEEEEEEEREEQREEQEAEVQEPIVEESTEAAESILPDEGNDDADQENGGEKVSIELVPAEPEPHVREDSESGFPQRTSSPEHCEYDEDVHMKTLSPEEPKNVREEGEAQSPRIEQREEDDAEEQRPVTPPEEQQQKESEDEDEKRDDASKRSSSPEEGELPDQSSKAGDSADEQSKESLEHNHSKSGQNTDDEEPAVVKKSPVKEVKSRPFIGKLTRNDGKAHVDEQAKKKRRWLSRKPSAQSILAISTDSLKPLIADVKPVPLVDVKLDLTSDTEGVIDDDDENGSEEETAMASPKEKRDIPILVEKSVDESVRVTTDAHPIGINRKILLVNDDVGKTVKPPSPPRNTSSCILYITNLVRPFTVLQLKGLLARTGRIVENGFWIDKIKSKCYVQYETEDQAVETRHALHGVRWPTSNPKCLHVDFGSDVDMMKAIESTAEDLTKHIDTGRGERIVVGWERDRVDGGAREQTTRPIREWDVGKKDDREKEKERDQRGRRERSKERDREDVKRNIEGGFGRERRRSPSPSPARKFKKENEPPIRLLDDLFRKTKATPSIYWLPLTPEQIAVKEETRRKNMQEHQRRLEELRKERNRERDRDRDRDRDRPDRDRSRRDRSRSRDRRYR
ncbi:apoptotic chromatin condensation inducer in the nucleus isoform X1 [Lutzomyia longipalpis]|uniref:apoptotic chromatin condensation inducer in the nucleus isoform X1 n=1 Tax=Lutzomyia longipalpis TaxID=7200 RepID=UPI0024839C7F|nr:apoptotic chromatin condensation inducer in the nucleus isoform X1 [Lutzomyia longipalpis]